MPITSDEVFADNRWYSHTVLCDVLRDMRKCCETLNFGPLPALIEEVQMMANRMETKLDQMKDLERLEGFVKARRKELDELRETFAEVRTLLAEKEGMDS